MAKKSLFVTYVLWLFGGYFGLHHFYLERDFQALIWWMFAGGYFGLGLIRDLWRIPEYVKDANEESSYMEELTTQMRKHETPPSGTVRSFGQIMVADSFGFLIISALPGEYISELTRQILAAVLAPVAVAAGVYLTGNIGRHEGTFISALIGASLTFPLYFFLKEPVVATSLASISYFNWYSKKWRRTPLSQKSLIRRITFLASCGTIYLLLWSSWLYFNCNMVTQEGETVRCKDAAQHFFKSPIWQEFLNVIKIMYETLNKHGWQAVWQELINAFDPVGSANALKVLGLKSSATQQEITTRYRRLSREWHPDKHKGSQEKEIAQNKFIEIQQAYEILSNFKSNRVFVNSKSSQTEEHVQEETVDYQEEL